MEDNKWIFVIDCDKYSGNYEREMCAFITGQTGECEVGDNEQVEFEDDVTDGLIPDSIVKEIEEKIMQVSDDHGTFRPCTIYETPGRGNDGMGVHFDVDPETDSKPVYPAYESVAIFFNEKPSPDLIKLMKKRALEFSDAKAKSFRLIEEVTVRTEIDHDLDEDDDMQDHYDFSKAKRNKYYSPAQVAPQQIDKEKLIEYLVQQGYLIPEYGYKKVPSRKPGHGSCCTCQTCGQHHDDCVCNHNEWIDKIEELTTGFKEIN